jgi:phenol 2-monooxygenase
MQFHHHGYVSEDPRVLPASGNGVNRSEEIPDQFDVLIVGTGPAGLIAAAQLAKFGDINTRIIELRDGRLPLGHADGIAKRSVETFQAFGFAEKLMAEAYEITEMSFWEPDASDPDKIVRKACPPDDPTELSEFPHLICNQARIQDFFLEVMYNGPARIKPDYGVEFLNLSVHQDREYPVEVQLQYHSGPMAGVQRTVHVKYLIGCDGAKSKVRAAIGRKLVGEAQDRAWAVMDILAETDFPDIRTKCSIHSSHGSILHIPREGNHLFRTYVDLGEVPHGDISHAVRKTTVEQAAVRLNEIIHPYTLEVRNVAWYSVYEVGHRVTDKFDEVPAELTDEQDPHVFICGDACHTHSAKAGQGMNVSMQDGWTIAWKLGAVLQGRAPASLLKTYSAERQPVAQQLIDFDSEWSGLMAAKPEYEGGVSTEYLVDFYQHGMEFTAGFWTQYPHNALTADGRYQHLADGFPLGKRFYSAPVVRRADANYVQLGHHATADGRWRVYLFADRAHPGDHSELRDLADWLAGDPESPVLGYTPSGKDLDSIFDLKVIYQQSHHGFETTDVPEIFYPRSGPFQVRDYEKVYATDPRSDIFEKRQISRDGAIVIVRPDQYVSAVLPLTAREELNAFFEPVLSRPERSWADDLEAAESVTSSRASLALV